MSGQSQVHQTPSHGTVSLVSNDGDDVAECPVCGGVADGFLSAGIRRVKPDRRCPACGSLERHRAVWLYFRDRTDLFTEPIQMLHVAPEPSLGPRLEALPNVDYLSGDLTSPRAMVHLDLTNLPYPDASFDVVYASQVLEHIPDDRRAMSEIYRVLRPGGWSVLLVPMFGKTTREDPSIVDPAERERLYGQSDHVRLYGHDGEYERRLAAAGFEVRADRFVAEMEPALERRYRMTHDEIIHFCTKPEPASA